MIISGVCSAATPYASQKVAPAESPGSPKASGPPPHANAPTPAGERQVAAATDRPRVSSAAHSGLVDLQRVR